MFHVMPRVKLLGSETGHCLVSEPPTPQSVGTPLAYSVRYQHIAHQYCVAPPIHCHLGVSYCASIRYAVLHGSARIRLASVVC